METLLAITWWPPVNHAYSRATTAISGCSTVTPYLRSTDWMRRVGIQSSLINTVYVSGVYSMSPSNAGLNLLLWGDLPELEDSENEESESPSEEECIR